MAWKRIGEEKRGRGEGAGRNEEQNRDGKRQQRGWQRGDEREKREREKRSCGYEKDALESLENDC